MARLSVGDEVTFQLGSQQRRARVVEDRGNLGVGGRRIFRVTVLGDTGDDDDVQFELAEDLLQAVRTRSSSRRARASQ